MVSIRGAIRLLAPRLRPQKGHRDVGNAGARDGALQTPVPARYTSQQPPAVMAIAQAARYWRAMIRGSAAAMIGDLAARARTARHLADEAEKAASTSERSLQDKEDEYSAKHRHPAPLSDLRFYLYWPITLTFALCEVGFSTTVFRMIGSSEAETVVFASVVAFSLVGISHFLGMAIKERRFI